MREREHQGPEPDRRGTFRWGRWLLLLVLGFGLAAFSLRENQNGVEEQGSRETAVSRLEDLDRSVLATGVVRPRVGAEVVVGSRLSGTVVDLAVRIGDCVRTGDLLARIDPSGPQSNVDEALAGVEETRSRLSQAAATLARRRALGRAGLVSAEELEEAQRALEVARARQAGAEARLVEARISLADSRVVAPIDGVVAAITTRQGETVSAALAAPEFVTIVDLGRLEVLAYVDETDIGRIMVGQAATFSVDTYPEDDFDARVVAIQPSAEVQGGVVNYLVRLGITPLEGRVLRPEMTAHVQVELEKRVDVVTVPRRAIRRRDGRTHVVVQRGSHWLEQEVVLGWRSESRVEIRSGLKVGEVVETRPGSNVS